MELSHIIHSEENLFDDIEIAHSISAYSMMIMVDALVHAYGGHVDVITVNGDNKSVAWNGNAPFYRKALKQMRKVFKECEKELRKPF